MKKFFTWWVVVLLLFVMMILAGCYKKTNSSPIQLTTGDTVKVDYVGTFDDGKVFDTSIMEKSKEAWIYQDGRLYQPLSVVLGEGMVIPGFEKAIKSLTATWQSVKVRLEPQDAYGLSDPKKIGEVPLEIFTKAGIDPQVWATYPFQNMQAIVLAISGNVIKLDANHPMAGKTLNFEITLQEVTKSLQ